MVAEYEPAAHAPTHHPLGGDPLEGYVLSTQLDGLVQVLIDAIVPVGSIMLWSGAIVDIPANWALCNGSNGTPDLRNRFLVGAGSTYAVGATGGATTAGPLTHSGIAISNHPAHSHANKNGAGTQSGSSFNSWDGTPPNNVTQDAPAMSHTITSHGDNHNAFSILPPYYALAYIMRVS